MKPLQGKVAVVTGASRGVGRGIAIVLGEAGATVYVTGRSMQGEATTEHSPYTLDETVDRIKAQGGVGIAVRCDHTVDTQIAALFAQVEHEQERLDILINNAWGGYEQYVSHDHFDGAFWEQPLARFDKMMNAGVRSNFVTTQLALPLLLKSEQGLIGNTTLLIDQNSYDCALPYCIAKLAINYMTLGMAHDLRKHGYNIAVVGIAPGWVRKEDGQYTPEELAHTGTPEYVGCGVLALATDQTIMQKSGRSIGVGDLAREYGFVDTDGRQPW